MLFMQRPTSFTPTDFAALGAGGMAYVKPVIHEGQPAYGIFGADGEGRQAWYRHWVETGFAAIERMLDASPHTGRFCHGDTPTFADCCLVPQVFNAERFEVPMTAYPAIRRITENCRALEAFRLAAPEAQPDAE